ncbi:MAG: CvpA family protein [Gammaproteobacteria bacterium]
MDIGIIAILAASALVSVLRGFVREVLSLLAWLAAFSCAVAFSGHASAALGFIQSPAARTLAAYVAVFLGTLLACGLVNFVVGRLLQKTGLAGTDRLLGLVFGVARGAAIVVVLVLGAGLVGAAQTRTWQGSMLMPPFQALAHWSLGFMPPETAAHFRS